MATPNFAQGWKGTVSIGGTLFNALEYEFEHFADLEDITYTAGADTARVVLPGYPGARGTISFAYDVANQPTISPFEMTAGTTMALVLSPEGTKDFSFSAVAGNFKFSSGPGAGAAVKCTTTFESTGPITLPTA